MFKNLLLHFLRVFAKKIIKKYRPDIIGITGSIGKTSTKEAISAVLAARFNVRANHKNYNNEIGLPLTIIGVDNSPGKNIFGWFTVFWKAIFLLSLRAPARGRGNPMVYPQILVLEMGSDKPGDIAYLTNIAPCKVGVLTYISHSHTEFFKTIQKIAQEKRVIISHLSADGFAVLNFDNPLVMDTICHSRENPPSQGGAGGVGCHSREGGNPGLSFQRKLESAVGHSVTKAKIITYGFKSGADFQATDVNIIIDEKTGWPSGLNFKILYKGSIVPVFLPGQVAEHLIPSALAAVAVGAIFGVNLVEAVGALRNLRALPGHMCLIPGIKNTLLIDDTYNSSPDPTKFALETLTKINLKPGAERYAVLGDMLELGAETENLHREIGFKVQEMGIDFLITAGEASKHTAAAAREAGLPEHNVASFADSVSAGKFLQEKLKEGDVALIKGSQGARMEKIVKEVMAEPLQAKDILVRQSEEWENR